MKIYIFVKLFFFFFFLKLFFFFFLRVGGHCWTVNHGTGAAGVAGARSARGYRAGGGKNIFFKTIIHVSTYRADFGIRDAGAWPHRGIGVRKAPPTGAPRQDPQIRQKSTGAVYCSCGRTAGFRFTHFSAPAGLCKPHSPRAFLGSFRFLVWRAD